MKRSVVQSAKHVALGLLLVGTLVSAAEAKDRKFYITPDRVTGGQALTACADGYHMASLWEIFDVSNFTYDTKLGFATDDSGSGPPVAEGWIRTGAPQNAGSIPGTVSCNVWTSSTGSDFGSSVSLQENWGESSSVVSPWFTTAQPCDEFLHVFCISNK